MTEGRQTPYVVDTDTPGVSSLARLMPKVSASQIRKEFPGRRGRDGMVAIDSVDLEVGDGEFVSIVGRTGCGKSTFLYIVAGFFEPSAGSVKIEGRESTGPGTDRGIVFQEFVLFPWKTVLGNVAYGLAQQGLSRRERVERARYYIEMVHLTGVEHLYPKELSGGMKQRVALARTLAADPQVLLMDEPFGSLDALTRVGMQEEVSKIWEQTGKSCLMVTHSIEEAIFLSDRIYVFSPSPARVQAMITVDIERPRDHEAIIRHPRYADLHAQIRSALDSKPDSESNPTAYNRTARQ
jgi:NitT/TauT family transport system ATP-binding protein